MIKILFRWVICSNEGGNSLSFFCFCLRANYIVLRLCGAQCNSCAMEEVLFATFTIYNVVSFQCLQGHLRHLRRCLPY